MIGQYFCASKSGKLTEGLTNTLAIVIYHITYQLHYKALNCGIIQYRDETILQYIDILQYLLEQYNTIWL